MSYPGVAGCEGDGDGDGLSVSPGMVARPGVADEYCMACKLGVAVAGAGAAGTNGAGASDTASLVTA
jgi:hypothetical protein